MRKLFSRFQVVVYFLLSAPIIPLATMGVLNAFGASESKLLRDVGTVIMKYAPSLAAVITVSLLSGSSGLRQLLKRFLIWRVEFKWYALALLLPLFLDDVIPLLVYGTAKGNMTFRPNFTLASAYLIVPLFARYFFLGGGMGEEFGWRGYLTPHFQARHSVLKSAVIVGILWAAWHFPTYWFSEKTALERAYVHVEKIARAVPMAIVFAWVFNGARGSVLIVALMHAATNAFGNAYQLEFTLARTGLFTDERIIGLIAIAGWMALATALVVGRALVSPGEPPGRAVARE